MQKKKKKVSQGKEKSVQKAVVKPIVKKAAKKLAAPKVVAPAKNKKDLADNLDAPARVSVSKMDPKSLTEEQLENYKKWLKLQKQLGDQATVEYKMSSDFELKSSLNHKIHGWGVVVQRRDNYIDVLFETGLKTLIVNYK